MRATATATVLTVEDDPIVRADLSVILEDAGFEVCAAARDGVEAVELEREHRPDLVLLDLGLPRLDGVSAARLISSASRVPIIALTGAASPLLAAALDAGVTHHVAKPFSEASLVETLREALAGARSVETEAAAAPLPTLPAPIPAADLPDQRGARILIDRMVREGYSEWEITARLQRELGLFEEVSARDAGSRLTGRLRALLGRG